MLFTQEATAEVAKNMCYICYDFLTHTFNFKKMYDKAIEKYKDTHEAPIPAKDSAVNQRKISIHKRRLSIVELQSRPFRCNVCDRGFNLKGEIEAHLQRHENKPNQIKCKRCGRAFLTQTHFDNHICDSKKVKIKATKRKVNNTIKRE